jgi:hypothetical protein
MSTPPADQDEGRRIWPFSVIHRQWRQAQTAQGFSRFVSIVTIAVELLIIIAVIGIIVI